MSFKNDKEYIKFRKIMVKVTAICNNILIGTYIAFAAYTIIESYFNIDIILSIMFIHIAFIGVTGFLIIDKIIKVKKRIGR